METGKEEMIAYVTILKTNENIWNVITLKIEIVNKLNMIVNKSMAN